VHELLQTEFGLEDGLASTVTWGEILPKHPGLKLPPLSDEPGDPRTISPDEPFVQILDPAAGTATFLVEAVDVIYRTVVAKWKKQGRLELEIPKLWNEYVPKHLLPRLHGYELLAAPYAIAHLKLGLKLTETGYRFGSDQRARIYLTNALEPKVKQLPQIGFEPLAHEARAVNEIKWYKRFTVVIGNPPYSNYGQLNKNPWIMGLLDDYKRGLGEKKINLDDDFIKFLRFCQISLDGSHTGLLGLITNHTYLDGVTHRRLRESLLASFLSIRVADLHGSIKKAEQCPDGSPDKNVFDIQQGVAIGIFSKLSNGGLGVWHSDVWGVREVKYEWLRRHSTGNTPWKKIIPTPDRFYFVPHTLVSDSDYNDYLSIRDAFLETATGFETARDHFAISFAEQDLKMRVQELVGRDSDEAVRARWGLDDKRDWQLTTARARLRQLKNPFSDIRSCCYRPFDNRFTHYNDVIVTWPRVKVLGCIDDKNPALVAARMVKGEQPSHFFVVNQPTEKIFISGKTSNNAFIFPMYQREGGQQFLTGVGRKLNFREDFVAKFRSKLISGEDGCNIERFATDIFHYAYAVFHSPGYRTRYAEFLKIDFPRLPLTGNLELFRALARLGSELVALHLLESPTLDRPVTEFLGGRAPQVEKVSWSKNTVWLDRAQTNGFRGVREEVWNFHIGGYQVCEKWLKDRKGRTLSVDDRAHYQKIVVALSETIRLMAEIDLVIDRHGGWPKAFSPGSHRGNIDSVDCSCELSRLHEKDSAASDFIAELIIVLPHLELPKSPNATLLKEISEATVRELQPQADQHFGPGRVRVTCSEVKAGSIELKIVLTVCVAGTFQFLKDYDKIRSNVLLFRADVRQNCGKLNSVIKQLLERDDPKLRQ
jgi:predicted helicase